MNFKFSANPIPPKKSIVLRNRVRISILMEDLIRIEYSENHVFEDRPTQIVWNRNFSTPDFEVKQEANSITLNTSTIELEYKDTKQPPSPRNLLIYEKNTKNIWYYGKKQEANLKGTCRTLDNANGAVDLEDGLIAKNGWTILDDSKSLVFDEDGWIKSRDTKSIDIYLFYYGKDYQHGLDNYFKIAGNIPLIPRWALGTWWSRYWEYSQEELQELMLEFQAHQIPLTVCIIDMDWHITDIDAYWEKQTLLIL